MYRRTSHDKMRKRFLLFKGELRRKELYFIWKLKTIEIATVQPKNNAHARSATRSSCAARTRKPPQEVKMTCFCSLPARTFETQEAESLTSRSRKKLKI